MATKTVKLWNLLFFIDWVWKSNRQFGIDGYVRLSNAANARGSLNLSNTKTNDLTERFYAYLDWKVSIPRIRYGKRSSIETLISEEALMLAKYLRSEKEDWIPRIAITN